MMGAPLTDGSKKPMSNRIKVSREGYGSAVSLVLGLFNNVPVFRFFCFFVERNNMDSSCTVWNKFQDYQVTFILTDHFFSKDV